MMRDIQHFADERERLQAWLVWIGIVAVVAIGFVFDAWMSV